MPEEKSADTWGRVQALWSKAVGLPSAERADWLESACQGDEDLRREVEELLSADERSEDRFERLVERVAVDLARPGEASSATTWVEAPAAPADIDPFPDRIGRIRVEGRLGQGGMGIVYQGVDEVLHRKVAIKAIRGPVDDPARLRLRREAEMLSSLEHPNICRLYDLVHHRGADYLILELIEGRTLGEVLREEGKPPRDTGLAIAQAIAEVLDLAHRSGIVHRDLKVSNVMLTADGEVKVLDFGIARAAERAAQLDRGEGEGAGRPGLTRKGAVVGSLSTMSPEQARGEAVTPASDMFSLGLLLQQLWTGEAPRKAETDQELLQLALRGDARRARGLSRDQARLVHRLRSLEADERPASSDVVAEIRRMRGRRARRLRRGALGVLAFALVASTWKYTTDLRRERDRARAAEARIENEREATERVVEFLLGLFSSSDPYENRPPEETAILRRLIDEGAAEVGGLAEAPLAKVRIEQALAEVYILLDEYDRAESLLASGLETLGSEPESSPLVKAWSLQLLSHVHRAAGDLPAAERLARDSLAIYESSPDADPARLATVLDALSQAVNLGGDYDEVERLLRRALEIRLREGDELDTVPIRLDLGRLRRNKNDLEGAAELLEATLALAEARLRPDHGHLGRGLSILATTYHLQSRNEEALPLFQRSLEIKEARLGPTHSSVSATLSNMANVYRELERWDEAEAAARRGIEIDRVILGADHSETAISLQILAVILGQMGEHAEAEALLIESVEIADRALGVDSLGASSARRFLADHWVQVGEHEKAAATYGEIIATYSRLEGESSWRVGEIEAELALLLAGQGRTVEAAALADRAYAKVADALGEDHPLAIRAADRRSKISASGASAS